jgi:hypothetical protein
MTAAHTVTNEDAFRICHFNTEVSMLCVQLLDIES